MYKIGFSDYIFLREIYEESDLMILKDCSNVGKKKLAA